jgi:hypothetical protein
MAYRLPLLNIYNLSDEDFASILPCDPDTVVTRREPHKIKENQAWLYEICRDISPSAEESAKRQRPFPRFLPLATLLKRGWDALVFSARDQWRLIENQPIEVVLKIPWPIFEHDADTTITPGSIVPQQKNAIEKGASGLYKVAKSLYKKLEKPEKKQERGGPLGSKSKDEEKKEQDQNRKMKESIKYERFHRSFMFQKQMHMRGIAVDRYRKYGYVPKTFDFGFDPKCFFSMEKITGIPYFDWVLAHSDAENLDIFHRVLIFVESVFHDGGIAHCDLDVDGNILVENTTPVFLDFGSAKGEHVPVITLPGTQIGKPGAASPTQLTDARERGYPDDILALGRIFWQTITRRRPAMNSILCQEINGKLKFDLELIQSLFDENLLPEKFREIFLKTWQNGYKDISEFRADLEGILFVRRREDKILSKDDDIEKLEALFEQFETKTIANIALPLFRAMKKIKRNEV